MHFNVSDLRSRFCRHTLVAFLGIASCTAPTLSESQGLIASSQSVISSPGADVAYSSPAVGELTGDPADGLEIVMVQSDGVVSAFDSQGLSLWRAELPNYSCALTHPGEHAQSSPTILERSSGQALVITGYGGIFPHSCPGGVSAIGGMNGAQIWNFNLRKFAKRQRFFSHIASVFSTPVVADVENDGTSEIAFGSFDRNLYLLNENGSVRRYYAAADTIYSSPLLVDVDQKPGLEVLFATDMTKNRNLRPRTKNGGFLIAMDAKKGGPRAIPFRDPAKRAVRWASFYNQTLWSSPAVGDLLPAVAGEEGVIGSGCYHPERSTQKKGRAFTVFSLINGAKRRALPVSTCSPSSPAIGDLNGDGLLEVVVLVSAEEQFGSPDGRSSLIAWTPATDQVLWNVPVSQPAIFQSPLIVDFDRDGLPEVVSPSVKGVRIADGLTGQVRLRLDFPGTLRSTPAVADLNGNGMLDIVAAGGPRSGTAGVLAIWWDIVPESGIEDFRPSVSVQDALLWSAWRGSSQRNGGR